MKISQPQRKFLFFHMGPGLHSKVEALYFSSLYPHIDFLNQPLNISFSDLIEWTCYQIRKKYEENQIKVVLLGHSFGAQLIANALSHEGSKVEEIRFLNSAKNAFDGFVNLHNYLNPQNILKPDSAIRMSVTEKMELIFSMASHPHFEYAYWQNQEQRKLYEKLASQFPPLETNSFVTAFSGYLKSEPLPKNLWDGSVKVIYSLQDSLIQSHFTVAGWKDCFPRAQFLELVNLGHYAYFESSLAAEALFKESF